MCKHSTMNYFKCQVCITLRWNLNCNCVNNLHMIVEIHGYTSNSSFGFVAPSSGLTKLRIGAR